MGVQISEIGVLARGEEGFSNVADRAFHAPLLIAARDGDRPRTATAHEAGSHQGQQRAATAMAAQRLRRRRVGGDVGGCNGGVTVPLQHTISGNVR
ncbi:hypothetical protein WJ74_24175 [Burkholderia ubonensis]|nr:hypothetical protein WJ74_24175 [Burkholderia ubonensis]